MPIVNRLKNLLLRYLQKKRSSSGEGSNLLPWLVVMLGASLITTYMELFFTGYGLYSFLNRPFPHIFTIDIRFPLIGIPVFTFLVITALSSLGNGARFLFIVIIAYIMMIGEIISENLGLLAHSTQWSHVYSFFGYAVFTMLIWVLYKWTKQRVS